MEHRHSLQKDVEGQLGWSGLTRKKGDGVVLNVGGAPRGWSWSADLWLEVVGVV